MKMKVDNEEILIEMDKLTDDLTDILERADLELTPKQLQGVSQVVLAVYELAFNNGIETYRTLFRNQVERQDAEITALEMLKNKHTQVGNA